MVYSWEELYPGLRFLYMGYKNRYGISVRDVLSKDKDLTYSQVYYKLRRMSSNGLFQVEKLPREVRGGLHPVCFVISKAGLQKVASLKSRGIYQESYADKYWRLW